MSKMNTLYKRALGAIEVPTAKTFGPIRKIIEEAIKEHKPIHEVIGTNHKNAYEFIRAHVLTDLTMGSSLAEHTVFHQVFAHELLRHRYQVQARAIALFTDHHFLLISPKKEYQRLILDPRYWGLASTLVAHHQKMDVLYAEDFEEVPAKVKVKTILNRPFLDIPGKMFIPAHKIKRAPTQIAGLPEPHWILEGHDGNRYIAYEYQPVIKTKYQLWATQ